MVSILISPSTVFTGAKLRINVNIAHIATVHACQCSFIQRSSQSGPSGGPAKTRSGLISPQKWIHQKEKMQRSLCYLLSICSADSFHSKTTKIFPHESPGLNLIKCESVVQMCQLEGLWRKKSLTTTDLRFGNVKEVWCQRGKPLEGTFDIRCEAKLNPNQIQL